MRVPIISFLVTAGDGLALVPMAIGILAISRPSVPHRIACSSYWLPIPSTPKVCTSYWRHFRGAGQQGAVLSPLLSNIYLNPLDHLMARQGYQMVRYADDFVILCQTKQQAEEALAAVQKWVQEAGLTLHPEKARIVDAATDRFEFLGYRFEKGRHWPRDKSKKKLRDAIRWRTKRTVGTSLNTVIQQINPTLRGWYGYFKHAVVSPKPSTRAATHCAVFFALSCSTVLPFTC